MKKNKFNNNDDSDYVDITYNCKKCGRTISEEVYNYNNGLCNRCVDELYEEFGDED
jgi:hypothetical protein